MVSGFTYFFKKYVSTFFKSTVMEMGVNSDKQRQYMVEFSIENMRLSLDGVTLEELVDLNALIGDVICDISRHEDTNFR